MECIGKIRTIIILRIAPNYRLRTQIKEVEIRNHLGSLKKLSVDKSLFEIKPLYRHWFLITVVSIGCF